MRDEMRHAECTSRSADKALWLLLVTALLLQPSGVFAQAGTTGGAIGREDKGVSGGQEENVQRHVTKRVPSKQVRSARARTETASPAGYDGTWVGISTGTCIPNAGWMIQVNGGIMSGNSVTGRIARGGAASGFMMVGATAFNFLGHFSSSAGFGTWSTTTGCSGKWSATKS
jgi:hypothetical protein